MVSSPFRPARVGLRSGGALALIDDAAQDVAADDLALGTRRLGAGYRLGEPKAAMGPGLVVGADVF